MNLLPMIRLTCAYALATTFSLATPAASAQCLEDMTLSKIGEMQFTREGQKETLEFLSISIEDFAFGDVETFTSAAYLRQSNDLNPNFHIWSLTAYPSGYREALAAELCGEDMLAVFDDFQRLAQLGGVLGSALSSVSPAQALHSPLFDAQLSKSVGAQTLSDIKDLRAKINSFIQSLPNPDGAIHLTFRNANLDPAKVMTNPNLSPEDMMQRLSFLQGPQLNKMLDSPETMTCPCEMELVEAHKFGPEGRPFYGPSLTWGLADTRKAPATVTLTSITGGPEEGYTISGSFQTSLLEVAPDTTRKTAFGAPHLTKSDSAQSVSGYFEITGAMGGNLTRLPKLF